MWEGNQVLEQMVGLSVHESGGGGYLVLADGWLGRRPPGPMPQLQGGVRTWARSIKIPRFLAVLGGTGILPKAALACAGGALGVEFRAL